MPRRPRHPAPPRAKRRPRRWLRRPWRGEASKSWRSRRRSTRRSGRRRWPAWTRRRPSRRPAALRSHSLFSVRRSSRLGALSPCSPDVASPLERGLGMTRHAEVSGSQTPGAVGHNSFTLRGSPRTIRAQSEITRPYGGRSNDLLPPGPRRVIWCPKQAARKDCLWGGLDPSAELVAAPTGSQANPAPAIGPGLCVFRPVNDDG